MGIAHNIPERERGWWTDRKCISPIALRTKAVWCGRHNLVMTLCVILHHLGLCVLWPWPLPSELHKRRNPLRYPRDMMVT